MSGNIIRKLFFVGAIALLIVGFRFVTQAGQGLDAIQKDGYAVSGGSLIFAAGLMIGLLADRNSNGKK